MGYIKMNADEQTVKSFFDLFGFIVKTFSKLEKRKSKTPDFKLFIDKALFAFCEVKTIEADDRLFKKIAMAKEGEIVGVGGE